jgi:Tfp pilus assembly protein PilO
MTLPLARIFAEKRRLVLPIVAMGVANLALFALVLYPLSLRVEALEARGATSARQAEQAARHLESTRAAIESRKSATVDLDRFYREVLPADQTGARRITYLRLARLARESRLQYERRSVDTKSDRGSALVRMGMTMVLDGSYADIRRFVHRLETSSEFVVISNVELTQQDDPNAPLLVTLELATYYRSPDGT